MTHPVPQKERLKRNGGGERVSGETGENQCAVMEEGTLFFHGPRPNHSYKIFKD